MKKRPLEFSKIITIISCVLFLLTLVMGYLQNFSTVIDVSFYATCVTVTGGIFGFTVKHLMNKSSRENTIKLNGAMIEQTKKSEINYYREILKLKKQFEITDEDIEEIKSSTHLDEFSEDSILESYSELKDMKTEDKAPIDIDGV